MDQGSVIEQRPPFRPEEGGKAALEAGSLGTFEALEEAFAHRIVEAEGALMGADRSEGGLALEGIGRCEWAPAKRRRCSALTPVVAESDGLALVADPPALPACVTPLASRGKDLVGQVFTARGQDAQRVVVLECEFA